VADGRRTTTGPGTLAAFLDGGIAVANGARVTYTDRPHDPSTG
jgi:hypothetical protein